MDYIRQFLAWCTGNGRYMVLPHCMDHDTPWIIVTVTLDLSIALGYMFIAFHWWRNARHLPQVPGKSALANLRNMFIFCGICGYVFIPIKMVWPAWRLYDMFLAVLALITWRFVLGSRDLRVVYSAIGHTSRLAEELAQSLQNSRRKAEFLNVISHDLRTPLNQITLQSNLAEISLDQPELLRTTLQDMRASAMSAARLLDTLLEFARDGLAEGKVEKSPVELKPLIGRITAAASATASAKGLTISIACPEHLQIITDAHRVERILTNLISNAIKFTERGSVRVDVDHRSSGVEIHVTDTGVGIAANCLEHLFDEFYQVDNYERDGSKGFGLGLAISRRLARQMGGDVVVQSAPNRGSRFSVLLPTA